MSRGRILLPDKSDEHALLSRSGVSNNCRNLSPCRAVAKSVHGYLENGNGPSINGQFRNRLAAGEHDENKVASSGARGLLIDGLQRDGGLLAVRSKRDKTLDFLRCVTQHSAANV